MKTLLVIHNRFMLLTTSSDDGVAAFPLASWNSSRKRWNVNKIRLCRTIIWLASLKVSSQYILFSNGIPTIIVLERVDKEKPVISQSNFFLQHNFVYHFRLIVILPYMFLSLVSKSPFFLNLSAVILVTYWI
jgi:hypothetical protein